jgi:hypothetical protein
MPTQQRILKPRPQEPQFAPVDTRLIHRLSGLAQRHENDGRNTDDLGTGRPLFNVPSLREVLWSQVK